MPSNVLRIADPLDLYCVGLYYDITNTYCNETHSFLLVFGGTLGLGARSTRDPLLTRHNGVARIWGVGTRPMPPGRFPVISTSRPDSMWGGGVVEEVFRDLRKRTRFAGGGGGGSGSNCFR